MFIETVPNRSSPPAVLLREAYRDEHGRAQKRTLANLSKLPGVFRCVQCCGDVRLLSSRVLWVGHSNSTQRSARQN